MAQVRMEADLRGLPWVLVATMNMDGSARLLERMGVVGPAVIVNQVGSGGSLRPQERQPGLIVETRREWGLSRSRNLALALASDAEYCLIADDDLVYVDGYLDLVMRAWAENPNADVLAFVVLNADGSVKQGPRPGNVGRLQTLKLRSVELCVKRSSVVRAGLAFDERFGAGAPWFVGEESIFLSLAVKRGLRVVRVPTVIAQLDGRPSTWFSGFDERFFRVQGRVYREVDGVLWPLLCVRWLVRNRARVGRYPLRRALKSMFLGAGER